MSAMKKFLAVCDVYMAAASLDEKLLSGRMLGDRAKVGNIRRNGADMTTSRFEAAMLWLSRNWPDDTDWPAGIDRPKALQGDEVA